MADVRWPDVRDEFFPEGSLRDIYVLDANIADWQAVLDLVRVFDPPPAYHLDGVLAPLPNSIEGVGFVGFGCAQSSNPMLCVFVEGLLFNCHFFRDSEIEFDISPAEILGQRELESLFGFMRRLSSLTAKPVVVTPENRKQEPFLRLEPGGDVEWLPPPVT